MHFRRRPAATAALALLLGLLLTACSSGGTSADPTPSPTPSPSPHTPTPPPLPAAARAHTKAGAVAFVRYYIDLINYAQRTLDDLPVRSVSAAHCASCSSAHRYVLSLKKSHARLRGGAWQVRGFFSVEHSNDHGELSVPVSIHFGPQAVIRGSRVTRVAGGGNVFTMFVGWRRDRWVVNQWTRAM